jgi:hypothetical protein
LTGAVVDNESWAGDGGSGYARVVIDSASSWIVTGNSKITYLECAGTITDAAGNAVTVVGTDGTVYVQGNSEYIVTVSSFTTEVNLDDSGAIDSFEDHNTL